MAFYFLLFWGRRRKEFDLLLLLRDIRVRISCDLRVGVVSILCHLDQYIHFLKVFLVMGVVQAYW